ncbi:Protein R05C11.4 [Aphelenchoides bicaudatus]|nr:Protein R05C11.4 [Aphelenchoides bicaudatus]
MRPPDLFGSTTILLITLAYANAEICPIDTPTEPTSTDDRTSALGPAKRLTLKPKSCPDFKDDSDQSYCCPSRITFGSYYCCNVQQKNDILSELASERRRQFVKKYLAVIIISTILLSILGIIVASIICKRVSICPLHHSKQSYSRSSNSFQAPSSHSVLGGSRYQPVGQIAPLSGSRHSGTFSNLNTTPPQANKLVSYDAPPPYECHDSYRTVNDQANAPAHMQHQFNRIMENQLNSMLQNDQSPSAAMPQRMSNEFRIVPPPADLSYPTENLNTVD